jgi:murein L,D-transpeptidase YcbB/YkuD
MRQGLVRTLVVSAIACGGAGCLLSGCSERGDAETRGPDLRIQTLLDSASTPVLTVQGDTVHLSEQTRSIYERRGYQPAWTDEDGLLSQGEALAAAFQEARSDGLEPLHYHAQAVDALMQQAELEEDDAEHALSTADVLLTEAFLRYANDVVAGTVDPDASGVRWQIPNSDSTDARMLSELLDRPDLRQALEELRPAVPFYDDLRTALPRYQKIADSGGWGTLAAGDKLEAGVTDPRVADLRRRLAAESDPFEAPLVAGATDPNVYDSTVAQAVTHFQERHGIEPDGKVGRETLAALNVPVEERVLSLQLNLDRWRWLPRELGEQYVLVNLPGFELAVMEHHQPALTMNVVVGQDGWNTPVFQDTLESIVVNPYWNVPPSIAEGELAAKDPGYFARNGFEVVNRAGNRVDPGSVDLSSNDYTIRQRPGGKNALGNVKFVFPNSMNIYLHDTPARHLFQRTRRMLSHGCIRVEKPKELADYLMATATSQPVGTYDRLLATGREQWVKLDKPVPIYILYFTAWADPQGSVSFFPDIYDRDSALAQVARAELGRPSSAPVATALAVEQQVTGGR